MANRRLRVGVDCDGVLGEFEHLARRALEAMGIIGEVDLTKRVEFDMKALIPKARLGEFWDLVCATGGHDQLPVYPGAQDGMARLEALGVEVYIVTSHPSSGRTWVWERDRWLHRHFGIAQERVIHTAAKHTFAGAMLIDDRPDTVVKWSTEHDGIGVLWAQPYNERAAMPSALGIERTNDWDHVAFLVEKLLRR